MSAERSDIEFLSSGVTCRAWLYTPDRPVTVPTPCIVMGHGLGGTRDAGLEPYAQKFAGAGYKVLLFDYRHFGASDGEPRQWVSVSRQLDDWAAAIACARNLPGVDANKIALWGSSFSGGHVVVAAARDGKVAAVSSQGPMMDGFAAFLNYASYAGLWTVLKIGVLGMLDQIKALLGLAPVYVPLIAPPGQLAMMSSHDSATGYGAIIPPNWRNQMTARLALFLASYRPIASAENVQCPILICVCLKDSLAPASSAIATAKRIGKMAQLKQYDIGHFDIYVGEGFKRSSGDQLAFFNQVLRG